MSGPFQSLLKVAQTSLLAVAPPPRVSNLLRKGRGSGRRLLSPIEQTETNHVLILGGGFGGLYTALRLDELSKEDTENSPITITLVDIKDKFVFSPLLYELATGKAKQNEVSPFFNDLLKGTNINFVQGYINHINIKNKKVLINNNIIKVTNNNSKNISHIQDNNNDIENGNENEEIDFDHLVVALGSTSSNSRQVKGVDQYALPFYTVDDALTLQTKLSEIKTSIMNHTKHTNHAHHHQSSPSIVIVGGGFIGVELACHLSDYFKQHSLNLVKDNSSLMKIKIKLIVGCSGILPHQNTCKALRRNAIHALNNAQVEICQYDVQEVNLNSLSVTTQPLGNKVEVVPSVEVISSDLTIWAAGSQPHEILQNSFPPITTNKEGRLKVDDYLSVQSNLEEKGNSSSVFALGDASVLSDPLPSSAQVVFQQSEYVAWNVWASIRSIRQLPFQFTPLGEILTFGNQNASIMTPPSSPSTNDQQGQTSDDDKDGGEVNGVLGSFLRRMTYALRMPTNQQRKQALAGYFKSSTMK
mmetsp:Transcript_5070/g.6574  ORF Transcript_5070/g.6574 Transcript_5070/m.6574 type:complete len:528 (-) Transcript_5070:132-1715(-)